MQLLWIKSGLIYQNLIRLFSYHSVLVLKTRPLTSFLKKTIILVYIEPQLGKEVNAPPIPHISSWLGIELSKETTEYSNIQQLQLGN
jgi:hypothetical protein